MIKSNNPHLAGGEFGSYHISLLARVSTSIRFGDIICMKFESRALLANWFRKPYIYV